ncbi:hypothetical protein Q5752_001439 [Cryptotrichosporon argae]
MWDYGVLVKDRASRHRLWLAMMMGAFGQLSGNGLTNYLPSLYAQVGVTSTRLRLALTLASTLISLPFALIGTYHTDRLGRRPVLIGGTLLCTLFLAVSMACSAAAGVPLASSTDTTARATHPAAGRAAIAGLILFAAAFAWGYTPLQPIYPSEVLSNDMRAAGMGCMVLATNLSMFLSQFAIPVALDKIGWWTYLPFVIWTLFEATAWYFLAVETRGRTLEELDDVFNAPDPVRASLRRRKAVGSVSV